jgi:hypothetical protein
MATKSGYQRYRRYRNGGGRETEVEKINVAKTTKQK